MATNPPVDRRKFLRAGVAAGAMALPGSIASASPADALRVAVIGCGGRAQAHLHLMSRFAKDGTTKVVGVCDVWDGHEDEYEQIYEGSIARRRYAQGLFPSAVKAGLNPSDRTAVVKDYRRLLDRKDVDAVVIATPDHWHARMILDAVAAGKDVLVEPPLTRTSPEALAVQTAVQGSDRVVMLAEPSLTDPVVGEAGKQLRAGRIGALVQLQASVNRSDPRGYWRFYRIVPGMNPRTIDWSMFLGPELPALPFDPATFAQWRCDARFSAGPMSDLFTKPILRLLTAAGLAMPRQVTASGGLYHETDGRTVPDVCTLVAEFDSAQLLVTGSTVMSRPSTESLRGRAGAMELERGRVRFSDESIVVEPRRNETETMWLQFLASVRGRNQDNEALQVAAAAAVLTATPVN